MLMHNTDGTVDGMMVDGFILGTTVIESVTAGCNVGNKLGTKVGPADGKNVEGVVVTVAVGILLGEMMGCAEEGDTDGALVAERDNIEGGVVGE